MGLLDEAIREHLELKRRSGADPGAVEREEQDAFAPPSLQEGLAGPDEQEREFEYEDAYYETEDLPAGAVEDDLAVAEDEQHPPSSFADLADAGQQDTAELDMQAAMDAEAGSAAEAAQYAAPSGGGWAKPYAGRPPEEDLLAWELPGDREREPPPQNIPGQERLSFE